MGMWWFRRRAAEQTAADLLDQCLARIERGEATLESCLAEHPEQAAELRPLLLTALATRSVATQGPTGAAYARMRARVLAAAAPRPMPVKRRPMWQPVATAGLALAFLAALAVPLSALQTSDAVPGDWDYGLKRAGERVRLAVTVNDADRREVHLALAEQREREIQALLEENRTEYIQDAVLALAREHASLQDSLSSNAISAPEAERIAATIERQERVLEQVVRQAPQEVANAALGARVTVAETQNAARQAAERREQSPAPTPTPPSTAQNRATPTPSPTPASTSEPSASSTATAESGESPTPSPTPSGSPSPSDSPTPSPSASPIASPAPSAVAPIGTPVTPAASQQSPTPTRTPPLPTTPLPVPNTSAPNTSPSPAGTPLPTLAPVIPGPITPPPATSTPVRTPIPTPVPTPAPTPTPEPTPPSLSSTTVPAPGVTLVPGIAGNFVYTGPPKALLELLEPAAGKYDYVSYRAPNGQTVTYRPGDPNGAVLTVPSGSEVLIIVTDTVTLRW
ncbi:MAG: DUF5667 domain-containing protein [Dehalococcoidia bacterium]